MKKIFLFISFFAAFLILTTNYSFADTLDALDAIEEDAVYAVTNVTDKLTERFNIGGAKVSIISVLSGVFVFAISMFITKILKGKILNSRIKQDNIKTSLASGIQFFGFVVSVLISLPAMGFSLTSFTLIASALSFGAGLGAQNIVNNFISGLIILFGRSIKTGDWIVINGQEGIVRQINISSTELETPVKSTLIIPNSNIISTTLTNLTHGSKLGTAIVKVSVTSGQDIGKIKSILLEIANDNKMTTGTPTVILNDINYGDFEFILSVFLLDVLSRSIVQNDLRVEIVNRFNKEGIKLS